MTDLEMTKLCAKARGLDVHQWQTAGIVTGSDLPILLPSGRIIYDPLHDDAQAMALVKFLKPRAISYNIFAGKWSVHTLRDLEMSTRWEGWDADLNRAIMECVAKMQKEKQK